MKQCEDLHLVIGGEAGQGLVTIGQLLCKALVAAGYDIVVSQSYHSRIRGGHNTFNIRMATKPIHSPGTNIDLLVALNEETVVLHENELAPEVIIVVDESWEIKGDRLIAVPYQELGDDQLVNVIAFGVLGALLDLEHPDLKRLIEQSLGKKKPDLLEKNLAALKKSYQWAEKQRDGSSARLAKAEKEKKPRMMLNGNEAMALGAMAAGLKFAAFYPMTPATSIILNIIARADEMGIVVEQAEDEIAAINMALGASYAGAPSMVATSGGGFALMTEAISLAGMTETPVVVVVAQRPGPATGLPTRTEQGDLEFVLHGGHGEFPRILLAPDSIESCFSLTREAFFLAERFQTPCFVLTDQFLADSYRAVEPFKLDGLKAVQAGSDPEEIKGVYNRYAVTESGISPRLLPGASRHLVVADSDEHTADGHITEDLEVRIKMVRKRLAKQLQMIHPAIPPTYTGSNNADLLLVCWGSSTGAVLEAAARLSADGTNTAVLSFTQVWPLFPTIFEERLQQAPRVIGVEGNATGQFGRLLKRECGIKLHGRVLRYDGLPLTADYIIDHISKI